MSAQDSPPSTELKDVVNRLWDTWGKEGMFELNGRP